MEKNLDLLQVLFDEENEDPIKLSDEHGNEVMFDQVAIIPYGEEGNKDVYVILKPIEHIEGVADDEAIVFKLNETEDDVSLEVEKDMGIAMAVFNAYYDLLEEATAEDEE